MSEPVVKPATHAVTREAFVYAPTGLSMDATFRMTVEKHGDKLEIDKRGIYGAENVDAFFVAVALLKEAVEHQRTLKDKP